MFIDVKQLFEVEGQVIPFTHDLDMSAIELWGTAPFDRQGAQHHLWRV